MPRRASKIRRFAPILAGAVLALALAPAANAAPTFLVNSTGDAGDAAVDGTCATAAGVCTLRAAVQEANATTGATVTVPAGTYVVGSTLVLSSPQTLQGAGKVPGPGATTISGGGTVRILDVAGTATVTGVVLDQGAAGAGKGGAASVRPGATLNLLKSTARRSTASEGGGLYNAGTLNVRQSTISANTAGGKGGGISNDGTAVVENATLTGNLAGGGGGIASAGTVTVTFATISGNQSTNKNGGGLYRPGGVMTVSSSILSQNSTGSANAHDCYGSPTFSGVNLVQDPQGCNPKGSALITGDPQVAPLADNGGAALTMAIPATSPAIDQVAAPCTPGVDERGVPRPGAPSARCDLGAFERSELTLSAALQAVAPGTSGPAVPSVAAGATQLPLSTLTGAPGTSSQTGSSLAAIQIRAIQIRAIQIRAITLDEAFLQAIRLDSTQIRAIDLAATQIRAITLSDVPVTVAGGWDALLAGTQFEGRPLQTLSLADVILLPQVRALTLSQIDLSATVLGSIPVTALLLSDVPLASLSLTPELATATDADRLAAWCAALPAGTCADLGVDPAAPSTASNTTLMSVALRGIRISPATLAAINLQALMIRAIDANTPVATQIRAIQIRAIQIRAIDLGATQIRAITLAKLAALAAPTCTGSCLDQTLADAENSGALNPGATLGDLLDALAAYLPPFPPGINDPVLTPLAQSITLSDLLPGLVDPQDVQWDTVNLRALNLSALADPPAGRPDPAFDYLGTLTVGGGLPADVTATLALPPGFVQAPATSVRLDGAVLPPCAATAAGAACAAVTPGTLRLTAPGLSSGAHTLRLTARAGIVLGPATATLDGTATAVGRTVAAQTATSTVNVTEAFELSDTAADVLPISPPLLTVAHLGGGGDRDWFRFDVGADQAARGVRLSAVLGNLAFDGDLVLFGPADPPLRGAPQTRLVAVEDQPSVDPAIDALATETLGDVPLSLPVSPAPVVPISVAATRGLNDERIDTAELRAGTYYLQVSGYNGAASTSPYSLRMRLIESTAESCSRPSPLAAPGTLPDLATLPAGLNTVFLVNRQRLAAAYGETRAADVVAGLQGLAGRGDMGVVGAVLPVDGDADVQSAYTAWDAAACSPDAANDVVRTIGGLIDRVIAARPGLVNVVVVGDDNQIPMARTQDGTQVANERTYGPSIGRRTPQGASLTRSRVLSDNPYGTVRSIGVNGHELFVPRLAVGRLVETPDEILAAVQTFTDFGGVLDPSTRRSFVAGYDFLSDGSRAVQANLATLFPDALTALISETWTRGDLSAGLLPATGPSPLISSVNAHFDHFRALPAFENATGAQANLFTTSDLGPVAGSTLRGTLLFSMGCHSGLSVSDIGVGLPSPDWAQALGARGASLVGNTGFGYGDTETVALSERLMANFSREIGQTATIGQALARAKRGYFADTPSSSLNPYDEKVLEQATFYGLPMYRVRGASTPPPATAATSDFALTLGDPTVGPSRFTRTVTPRGRIYSIDGLTHAVQDRPIQPKVTLEATRTGEIAHGALLTGLSSVDLGAFDPVYFRPVVDLTLDEPETSGEDAVFPAAIQSVTPPLSPDDPFQRLVLVPGQFREPVPGTGIGTERLFTRIAGTVLYAAPSVTDFEAPRIVSTVSANRAITVTTDATATRVLALYRPAVGNAEVAWRALDLVAGTPAGGLVPWTAPLPADAPDLVQYFVQAPDENGNVAVSTNKGVGFSIGTPPARSGVSIALSPAPSSATAWLPGPVVATLASDQSPALPLEVSVDAAPFQSYTGPVSVTGDGVHTVEGRDSRGASAAVVVRIDADPPAIDTTLSPAPNAAGWIRQGPATLAIAASDAGAGVTSLTYSARDEAGGVVAAERTVRGSAARLDIAREGVTTVTITATDGAGRTSTRTVDVRIDQTAPTITIAQPVDGASFTVNQQVPASFTCSDAGSTIASCTGTVAAGSPIDTSAGGGRTFTVTAVDVAGNTFTKQVTYQVRYGVCLLYDPTKAINQGSTVPLKIRLCDANGANVSSAAIALRATSLDGSAPLPNDSGNSNSDTFFRFDATNVQYVYTMQSKTLAIGDHVLKFVVGTDPFEYPLTFTIR